MKLMSVEQFRNDFEVYMKPCLYELTKAGTTLYVGSSNDGVSGVFSQKLRSNPIRLQAFLDADKLAMTFYETFEEASEEEKLIVHEVHPPGQPCPLCLQDGGADGDFSKRPLAINHLKTAQELVDKLGHLPPLSWMAKNGYTALRSYAAKYPELFAGMKKDSRRQKVGDQLAAARSGAPYTFSACGHTGTLPSVCGEGNKFVYWQKQGISGGIWICAQCRRDRQEKLTLVASPDIQKDESQMQDPNNFKPFLGIEFGDKIRLACGHTGIYPDYPEGKNESFSWSVSSYSSEIFCHLCKSTEPFKALWSKKISAKP